MNTYYSMTYAYKAFNRTTLHHKCLKTMNIPKLKVRKKLINTGNLSYCTDFGNDKKYIIFKLP